GRPQPGRRCPPIPFRPSALPVHPPPSLHWAPATSPARRRASSTTRPATSSPGVITTGSPARFTPRAILSVARRSFVAPVFCMAALHLTAPRLRQALLRQETLLRRATAAAA